jgi:hypothetical protein
MTALRVFVALALANFVVQYLGQEDYLVALERSYFQGVALVTYWFIVTFVDKKVDIGGC